MPYSRQFAGSLVWMASYYVPNELLPAEARKPGDKTRIYEPATGVGYPNSKPGARQLEKRRKGEISEGTYSYTAQGELTAARWVAEWTPGRAARGRDADRRRVELHFFTFDNYGTKKMVDFRPSHFRKWAEHGRALVAAGKMSSKNFRNAYGVVHTMFEEAVAHEKIVVNPCTVTRADLPAKRSKKGRRYEDEESRELVWCLALPVDVRMLFCILSYTGERVGEGCGHIWANWDRDASPLGALTLEWAYDRQPLKSSTDKERPRVIPVHPELAAALTWWLREGWEAFYGRPPRPQDPIIPNLFKQGGHHTAKSIYHRSRDAFEAAELPWKAHHACRHAFITAARRKGAPELYIERITHNASGSTVDHYTHTEWEPLCAVVALLPWKRVEAQVIPLRAAAGGEPVGDGFGDVTPETGVKVEREKGFETRPLASAKKESAGNRQLTRSNITALSTQIPADGNLGAARRQFIDPEDEAFEEALAEHAERALRGRP